MSGTASNLGLLAIVIIVVFLIVILRKKFFALLGDIAIGTIVYLIGLFLVNWLGFKIPLTWAEIGYPIMLIIFIVFHILSGTNFGAQKKPWGSIT